MSIIYFLIILSVLVLVHELGHFFVARYFKIPVEEFGLGFPPRAKKLFVWKGTLFTLNWLPIGGFVKIFGENPNEEGNHHPDSFSSKPRGAQALVLVAGVTANFLFAWLLISIGLVAGLPAPAGLSLPVTDSHTVITTVLKDSPADHAGLKSGDEISDVSRSVLHPHLSPEAIADFITASPDPLTFEIKRGGESHTVVVTPQTGIVEEKSAVGIAMDTIGIVKLPIHKALYEGLKITGELTYVTAASLFDFIGQAFRGKANLSEVTGPVGLVGMVGDVRTLGFVYLLSFTALISLNLSVINLLPIPALDGGRLLFVIIEAIRRKPISPRIFNMANSIGFALLLLLMAVITFRDITHLI
jgi:regulator of sigma E protease